MTVMSLFSQFLHSTLSRPPIFIIYLLMPFMAHDYVLYVTFVASKIVLRHPKCDASKNVSTLTISEFYEILCASYISRDDSNGVIHFVIRDLENKFRIFNRNNNFVIKITILPFFQKLEFLGSYSTYKS